MLTGAVDARNPFLMLSFDECELPDEGAQDGQINAFFRCFLPDFYFVNTPLSRMRRQLQLLRALPKKPLQIEFHAPPSAQFTELMLCAYEPVQSGFLAQMAGALADLNTKFIPLGFTRFALRARQIKHTKHRKHKAMSKARWAAPSC